MIQAYNFMIGSYLPKQVTRNNDYRRSEIKRVYENIIKLSKSAPYYKVNFTKENQAYAINIKEWAISLKSEIADMAAAVYSSTDNKLVEVSDEQTLTASLINKDTNRLPDVINITVNGLAAPQINRGRDVFNPSKALEWGEYGFRARIKDETYELKYNQKSRTSNLDTMNNITAYLNENLPDITASVESGDNKDYSHITIKTDYTGRYGDAGMSFEEDDLYGGIVDFFGLDRMESAADNARFILNGSEKQTGSNTFLIENTLQVTLHKLNSEPVTLKLMPDSKPVLKQLDSIIKAYNGLVQSANIRKEESEGRYGGAKDMINEIKNIEASYQEELNTCGLNISEDGTISRDGAKSEQAVLDGSVEAMFNNNNGFIAKILGKADTIAINPIDYIDKTIVTYPNREKAVYANPYITSMYSGLLYNSYC